MPPPSPGLSAPTTVFTDVGEILCELPLDADQRAKLETLLRSRDAQLAAAVQVYLLTGHIGHVALLVLWCYLIRDLYGDPPRFFVHRWLNVCTFDSRTILATFAPRKQGLCGHGGADARHSVGKPLYQQPGPPRLH